MSVAFVADLQEWKIEARENDAMTFQYRLSNYEGADNIIRNTSKLFSHKIHLSDESA